MNESAGSTAQTRPRRLAALQLLALGVDVGVLGLALAMASLLGLRFGTVPNVAVATLGAALAVISVAAIWLALGPLAIRVRSCGAPLVGLAALSTATVLLAISGANGDAVLGVFIAGTAQFLLLQAPYWLFGYWHRLRIAPVAELGEGSIERLQYSLGQMLLVMTIVALALAIGRGVLALVAAPIGSRGVDRELVGFFALLVGYNLLLAWPLVWAVLSPFQIMWKVAAATVLVVLVLVVTHPMTSSLLEQHEGPWIYWLIFAPQPAYLLTHLVGTRLSGYRLLQL